MTNGQPMGWPFAFATLGRRLNRFDLDVDAAGQVEAHQGIDRLVGGLFDVQEPVVDPELKVLHRLLVDVGATDDAKLADAGRERDRAAQPGAGALGGLGDLLGALVQDPVVVGPDTDANGGCC